MTRQFSLAHLTVLGCTPPEAVTIAAKAGYDLVGLRLIALGLPDEPVYDLSHDKAMLRETKAALAATGLRLLDVEVARISDDRQVSDYRPALEIAAELGARHVLTSVFGQDRLRIMDELSRLCDLASGLGLTVDLEFMPFSDLRSLAEAYQLVLACGRGELGILVDTLHFDRSESTVAQLQEIPGRLFRYVQLDDAPHLAAPSVEQMLHTARRERLYLGEGNIPVASILSHLPPIPLSLEIAHAKRQEELGYREFARQCLVHARRYFEDAAV